METNRRHIREIKLLLNPLSRRLEVLSYRLPIFKRLMLATSQRLGQKSNPAPETLKPQALELTSPTKLMAVYLFTKKSPIHSLVFFVEYRIFNVNFAIVPLMAHLLLISRIHTSLYFIACRTILYANYMTDLLHFVNNISLIKKHTSINVYHLVNFCYVAILAIVKRY
jgi:hypothetical protein